MHGHLGRHVQRAEQLLGAVDVAVQHDLEVVEAQPRVVVEPLRDLVTVAPGHGHDRVAHDADPTGWSPYGRRRPRRDPEGVGTEVAPAAAASPRSHRGRGVSFRVAACRWVCTTSTCRSRQPVLRLHRAAGSRSSSRDSWPPGGSRRCRDAVVGQDDVVGAHLAIDVVVALARQRSWSSPSPPDRLSLPARRRCRRAVPAVHLVVAVAAWTCRCRPRRRVSLPAVPRIGRRRHRRSRCRCPAEADVVAAGVAVHLVVAGAGVDGVVAVAAGRLSLPALTLILSLPIPPSDGVVAATAVELVVAVSPYSLSAPGPPESPSSPSPPQAWSLPAIPLNLSLPPLALNLSFLGVPLTWSALLVPWKVFASAARGAREQAPRPTQGRRGSGGDGSRA